VTLQQENKNLVNSSCLKIELTDKNEINLQNAIPIIDEKGKKLTPYEFTVTNVCETNATFDITLEILNETTFEDLDYIKNMVPNVSQEVIVQLKSLKPGNCVAFGSAFKVPVFMYVDKPSPTPLSNNVDVNQIWYHYNQGQTVTPQVQANITPIERVGNMTAGIDS